jgi:hypothetical protein
MVMREEGVEEWDESFPWGFKSQTHRFISQIFIFMPLAVSWRLRVRRVEWRWIAYGRKVP